MVYTQLNFNCLFSSAQSRLAKSFPSKSINCVRRGKNILSIMFYAKKIYFYHCLCSKVFNTIENMLPSFKANFRWSIKQRSNFETKSLSTFQPFTYVSNERYLINEMCIEGFSQRLELRIDQHWNGWMPKILPKNYDIQRIFWSINDCTNASAWLVLRQIMVVRIYTSLNYFIFWFISMHWLVIVHIFCHVEK